MGIKPHGDVARNNIEPIFNLTGFLVSTLLLEYLNHRANLDSNRLVNVVELE